MITIDGKITRPRRVKCKCPRDGVHRRKPNGGIRTPRMCKLNGKTLFYGNEIFYMRHTDDTGLRVYYRGNSWEHVEAVANVMLSLGSICVQPIEIVPVALDMSFRGHPKGTMWALEVEHAHYHERAWSRFCRGHPYDWNAVKHPDHSPRGFKWFVKNAKVSKAHKKSLTLGSATWCTKRNRWIIIDVDWRPEDESVSV